MVVTIEGALRDERFRLALPHVEVEGAGLGRPVRWVFTNEREDVANFLSGGEMLVIEGNALTRPDRSMTDMQYAKSLVDAGVAALVVELVEGVTAMPPRMLDAARRTGLTLIGLKARVPFVDLCQSVNTAIVRERMSFQHEVDTMSNALREGLSHVNGIDAVAGVIAGLFGESVAVFDADGLLAAEAGGPFRAGEPTVVIALRGRPRPVGALEISCRASTLDDERRRAVASIVAPVAALHLDGGARVGMIRHLTEGPADGVHATAAEAGDAHAMLDALGFAGSCIYMPFALRFRSLVEGLDAVSAMIERFCARRGCDVACVLEGDVMAGWLSAADLSDGLAEFSGRCLAALEGLGGDGIYVVHGKVAMDTVTLVDGFAGVNDVLRGEARYGEVVGTMAAAVDRFVATGDMDEAVRTLIVRTIGHDVLDSPMLLDTLCACFDNLDNKTGACAQLGIRRQTLYNRLDKVTQMIGVDHNDPHDWSTLLFAAKIAEAWRRAGGARDGGGHGQSVHHGPETM